MEPFSDDFDAGELRVRRMLMSAMMIGRNISDLWEVYQELFNEVDMDDPEVYDRMESMIIEFEQNLIDVLDQVQGQIYAMTGMWEPLPVEDVEDFEANVLTTLAGLDTVDLEDYRIEYEDDYEDDE